MRAIDADALEELFREVIFSIANRPEMSRTMNYMVRASAIVIEMIHDAPTITPERKQGRWIKHEDRAAWYCSECATDDYYAYFYNSDTGVYELQDKFCPNCGADMRGGQNEAD